MKNIRCQCQCQRINLYSASSVDLPNALRVLVSCEQKHGCTKDASVAFGLWTESGSEADGPAMAAVACKC